MELTPEEKIYFTTKITGVLLIGGGILFLVVLPFSVWGEPMKSVLIAYDRMKYIYGFMIIGAVSGIIGILILILKQKKIYWALSLVLFISGVGGLYMYRKIVPFFSTIDKKSFVDSALGGNKMAEFSTILYITVLFIGSVVLLYHQHKAKIRQRPALKVQGHKVKSKLPSGKSKKKQQCRS